MSAGLAFLEMSASLRRKRWGELSRLLQRTAWSEWTDDVGELHWIGGAPGILTQVCSQLPHTGSTLFYYEKARNPQLFYMHTPINMYVECFRLDIATLTTPESGLTSCKWNKKPTVLPYNVLSLYYCPLFPAEPVLPRQTPSFLHTLC